MEIIKYFSDKIAKLRKRTSISFLHICPTPPSELMAVLARIGGRNTWEQRRCAICRKISHWVRDSVNEPFKQDFHPLGGTISIDLSEKDLLGLEYEELEKV